MGHFLFKDVCVVPASAPVGWIEELIGFLAALQTICNKGCYEGLTWGCFLKPGLHKPSIELITSRVSNTFYLTGHVGHNPIQSNLKWLNLCVVG